MPSEKAVKLAGTILEDFRGAGYYADPKILADYLKGETQRKDIDEAFAIGVIRSLLRTYARGEANVRETLAASLGSL